MPWKSLLEAQTPVSVRDASVNLTEVAKASNTSSHPTKEVVKFLPTVCVNNPALETKGRRTDIQILSRIWLIHSTLSE